MEGNTNIPDNFKKMIQVEEKDLNAANGLLVFILDILAMVLLTINFLFVVINNPRGGLLLFSVIGFILAMIIGPILLAGIKVLNPNEALVLTLFGKYYGTLKGPGIFFVNPFCTAVNPAAEKIEKAAPEEEQIVNGMKVPVRRKVSKKISLKTLTLNNGKQKINDLLGNPIIIVLW